AAGQGSGTPRRGGTGLVPVVAAAEHTAGHAAGAGEPEAHDAAHDESRGSAAHTALPAPGPATFLGRGVVRVPTTGVWNAVVRIGTGDEVPLEGEAAIQTVDGGPNPLYLGATGSLIGASLLYGAVERQRRGARDAGRIPTPKKAR
ncbi:MAG TPA: hypothetical protein VFX49_03550, partial [Chloroflexota bacterium]|nr:hypothetical protein [Chloroflexota bacterium]